MSGPTPTLSIDRSLTALILSVLPITNVFGADGFVLSAGEGVNTKLGKHMFNISVAKIVTILILGLILFTQPKDMFQKLQEQATGATSGTSANGILVIPITILTVLAIVSFVMVVLSFRCTDMCASL